MATGDTLQLQGDLDVNGFSIMCALADTPIFIVPGGSGALAVLDSPSLGQYAVDWSRARLSDDQCASGTHSAIGGGGRNTASGAYSAIGGGTGNTASRSYATVAGGINNQADGYGSFVGSGYRNVVSGHFGAVPGGLRNTADGHYSVIAGGYYNTGSGLFSSIGGGLSNYVSGRAATIAGGYNSDATANFSTIGGGYSNYASGVASTIAGGYDCEVGVHYGTVSGGQANRVYGQHATVAGGQGNQAGADYSAVPGGSFASADHYGEIAHASGKFAAAGDAQTSVLVARAVTTDTTAEVELFLDGASQRMTLADGDTWFFNIHLVAREVDQAQRSCAYHFQGVVGRTGSSTTIVDQSAPQQWGPLGVAFGTANALADEANEALVIKVRGVEATTIRWVARIELTRVNALT